MSVDAKPLAELEESLARDVPCIYHGCGQPADVRAKLHLKEREGAPESGCSSRVVFLCAKCLNQFIGGQLPHLPRSCNCGSVLAQLSDVLLWWKALR